MKAKTGMKSGTYHVRGSFGTFCFIHSQSIQQYCAGCNRDDNAGLSPLSSGPLSLKWPLLGEIFRGVVTVRSAGILPKSPIQDLPLTSTGGAFEDINGSLCR